ncbi:hypothetical protein Acr_12g0005630 [Actinidia rufa]|uniref:Transmembrane protein n=1 Tax=Actinidia rufa TaxID=165716 RepID=A0A7J0FH40_9ERIC|nr:hypothetical protein Acr_12g0005630 [Actinidia rufa]
MDKKDAAATALSTDSKAEAETSATALPTDSKAKAETPAPSYDDFEPFCSWNREEGKETLVVHVPVTARFTKAGLLYIVMPKKIASEEPKQDQSTPGQQPQGKPNVPVIGGGLKAAMGVAAMVVVFVVAGALGGYATYKSRFSNTSVGASVSYASNM